MGQNGDQFAKLNREIKVLKQELQKEKFLSTALWELVSEMTRVEQEDDTQDRHAAEVTALRNELDAVKEQCEKDVDEARRAAEASKAWAEELSEINGVLEGEIRVCRQANRELNEKLNGAVSEKLQAIAERDGMVKELASLRRVLWTETSRRRHAEEEYLRLQPITANRANQHGYVEAGEAAHDVEG